MLVGSLDYSMMRHTVPGAPPPLYRAVNRNQPETFGWSPGVHGRGGPGELAPEPGPDHRKQAGHLDDAQRAREHHVQRQSPAAAEQDDQDGRPLADRENAGHHHGDGEREDGP